MSNERKIRGTLRDGKIDELVHGEKPRIRGTFVTADGDAEWTGWLTDDAEPGKKSGFEKTRATLHALGWKSEQGFGDLTGMTNAVELVVFDEEYNGRTRLKVKYVNGDKPAAPPDFIASLNAKLGGKKPATPVEAPF